MVSDIKEEHKLRTFENSVLRRIFGLKRAEIMVGWRKLHKELPSIIKIIKLRRMRWA
jgi:hypothetical protein